MSATGPNVALFATCLVDLFRPSVGFSAAILLEEAGCRVTVPVAQTCCGQPAYNTGDKADAADIARQVITEFADYDYVVVPSGSCAGMIKHHYPQLFADDPEMAAKAAALSEKTFELMSFLTDVLNVPAIHGRFKGVAAYHDSCSGLRELGIKRQPRQLLSGIDGLSLEEYDGAETCCGFGGAFCVKYDDVSDKIVSSRLEELARTEATHVLGGDMGCLFNLAGKLKREGSTIQVRHAAEVLAGLTENPAIGETDD